MSNSDLIVFLDEDDKKTSIFVTIKEIKDSYVTFKNVSDNTITIPMSRVLKIKRREQ